MIVFRLSVGIAGNEWLMLGEEVVEGPEKFSEHGIGSGWVAGQAGFSASRRQTSSSLCLFYERSACRTLVEESELFGQCLFQSRAKANAHANPVSRVWLDAPRPDRAGGRRPDIAPILRNGMEGLFQGRLGEVGKFDFDIALV